MKQILFKGEQEYNKLEFLTGYENLEYNKTKFWNSMDYIIADTPQKANKLIPGFIKLPGYYLTLYDASSDQLEDVFILSKEVSKDYMTSLAMHIEVSRLAAIEAKKYKAKNSSRLWAMYYEIIKSFTSPVDLYYDNRLIRKKSFDYGYACSIHKSQGSSINNVFIDMKNVKMCRDKEELRQLQYVGVSRARKNVYVLQ
jgi:hypothetical protein